MAGSGRIASSQSYHCSPSLNPATAGSLMAEPEEIYFR